MRFIVKQTGSGSERIGNLTSFIKSPGIVIETPTPALFTQGGSVVNLTADVLSWVFSYPKPLWMPLTNCIQLENGVKAQKQGVAKFAGLPEYITCASLNDLSEVTPLGHFEGDKVPLWTRNGKKMITADRYMDVMEIFKPDMILAIADGRISLIEDGSKRLSKSVDRTTNMLKTCIERYNASKELQNSALVGVIVGAGNDKKCDICIGNILKHKDQFSGIALEGITDGTEQSMDVNIEKLSNVFSRIGSVLPKELLRIVEGCWNPAVIMTAIEHGWDFFDGSYPVKLTNAGVALKLSFDVTKENDEYLLDMADERYKEDFSPILDGCECLSCKKHTRAYIRHLLNTREMLAAVLLSIHNLHHFDQMFYHARQHIAANTFTQYKEHIMKQCEQLKNFAPDRYKASKETEISTNKKKKAKVSDVNSDAHSVVNSE